MTICFACVNSVVRIVWLRLLEKAVLNRMSEICVEFVTVLLDFIYNIDMTHTHTHAYTKVCCGTHFKCKIAKFAIVSFLHRVCVCMFFCVVAVVDQNST